ncbi:MAG TPA: helix-turn-helix domain-containing protein [Streptosporangiaceae bacterium]|nr:helix-turn-helix domain-containing protein [Streptosporangiaceae bacterium]
MSIGAALADARWQAHLTVDEVSHRTRIREAIIWGIEQDDFSACGGDAYARGHIRAIAQAVDTDPDPLIAQYDRTYRNAEDIDDVVALKPPPPPGRPPKPHRRGALAGSAALGVVILALVAWAIYHVASGVGHPKHSQAVAGAPGRKSSAQASGAAANGQGSPQPSAAPTTPSAAPTTPSPTPTPAHSTPPAPASQALSIAGASAFGPGGQGSGDTPQNANLAIDSLYSTGWRSDWYTTAAFGNLKPGTGLLLDLGRRVTINDAQLDLGGFSGADIQLKAGNTASPGDLHEVASANGVSGRVTVNLKTAARAKYLLIWFTQLPSDGAGTYRAAIYHVIVRGHS